MCLSSTWQCDNMADVCVFVFYRLEDLVNTIVADAGGAVSPSFEFTFKGDFCTLDWEYDLKSLTYSYGEVSNHMME